MLGTTFGSHGPKDLPSSLFEFITLITYLFPLLLFACLACLRASLCSRTLAPPRVLIHVVLACLSTYVIKPFLNPLSFFLHSHQQPFSVYSSQLFIPPPPHSLSVTFHFFYSPYYLPDSLQPASLLCLFALCVASVVLWSYGWVGLTGCVLRVKDLGIRM